MVIQYVLLGLFLLYKNSAFSHITLTYFDTIHFTYHFPLFAGQYDSAVGLLQPAGVSSGQVVKASVDVLAHSHDIIEVLLSGHRELKACLGQSLGELEHCQAGINLHLEITDEIQSGGDIIVDCIYFLKPGCRRAEELSCSLGGFDRWHLLGCA